MPRADTALEMLRKTASLVKPIMRRHGWVLPVLAEFFPDNPGLLGLNVNMGQNILVRLRHAGSPDAFLPLEDVVGTMLHELTHNVHGPHDDQFYKFLAGLQGEYDALRRSGYAGEGFYSRGRRVGEDISHNVPEYVGRLKALEAAEARRRNSRILVSGGSRLGGGTKIVELSPREMAARAAVQRARDEKSCASGTLAQQEAEKAAKASVESEVIDLTLDDLMDDYIYSDFGHDTIIIDDNERTSGNPSSSAGIPKGWSCTACTFINLSTASHCDMCDSPRPKFKSPEKKVDAPSRDLNPTSATNRLPPPLAHPDWSCSKCTLDNSYDFWSCAACGTIKSQG